MARPWNMQVFYRREPIIQYLFSRRGANELKIPCKTALFLNRYQNWDIYKSNENKGNAEQITSNLDKSRLQNPLVN